MGLKIIITGATGMVGEGVLLTCLENPQVEQVLIVSRRHYDFTHPKLTERLVPDFFRLDTIAADLKGFDACFFCAGVTSIGKGEDEYRRLTYDTTIAFAQQLLAQSPDISFIYVSGAGTDSSEKGRSMWARVKGKTENDLAKLPFKKEYNFRPGFMKAVPGQKNPPRLYYAFAWMYPFLKLLMPNMTSTLQQVGTAMINAVTKGYPANVLEVKDINKLGAQ
ncbi:NAD dependent epimerase/dehydratase family protein [Chitinophaga jiangningensis]|uniref:NAD dependent epimerase/dehydratase family protein n=1 Tax=Chitinophaga jiangningensis TaxID=1419482 RepID=A0A1M7L627_9BACT|nr:NAD-dependent epimerase/dehydratase family protein [Chitinophaga jiangningensis]SHM73405.1 NAD dependent epimerase/dehydratase family protein [Chitinophaga jiangningensis]